MISPGLRVTLYSLRATLCNPSVKDTKMTTSVAVQVTSRGILIPRSLIAEWDVQEVEIERHPHVIIIKPKDPRRDAIISEMKATGLVEELLWTQPPLATPQDRARLAEKLSVGKPLSELIIEERENRE